jgi:serine/threonine-protein kinase
MSAAVATAWHKPVGREPFARGEVIDDEYRVGELLGAGGMSWVYEAEDLRLGRRVALKVANDRQFVGALEKEARALSAIRHPGVVQVHAMREHAGHAYLVLERLHGRTLQEHLDEARERGRTFAVDEALDLLIGISDALAAAHRVPIAHRDLKPDNVLLAGARIVLFDFGLFVPEVEVRAHPELAGCAEFIAPEVIQRKVVPGEGPLIDLYALGILAHELLVGRTPFLAETWETTLARHLRDYAPRVDELRADLPSALADLVAELVQRRPCDRPSGAEEVLWRLLAIRHPSGFGAGVRPLRVLVIDDDPRIASVLRRSLKTAMPQLAVETETDPVTAVQEVERSRPDLVLLDLHMPQMNGIEVAMAFQALPPAKRPRVVATSTSASEADRQVLRSLGVATFVPKDDRFVIELAAVIGELRHA